MGDYEEKDSYSFVLIGIGDSGCMLGVGQTQ
jgi:hypothetical protein